MVWRWHELNTNKQNDFFPNTNTLSHIPSIHERNRNCFGRKLQNYLAELVCVVPNDDISSTSRRLGQHSDAIDGEDSPLQSNRSSRLMRFCFSLEIKREKKNRIHFTLFVHCAWLDIF